MGELESVKKALRARIGSLKVATVPGLADDLRAILGGFEELERRVGILATFAVRAHDERAPQSVHPAELDALSGMSDHAASLRRIAEHKRGCTCHECMPAHSKTCACDRCKRRG